MVEIDRIISERSDEKLVKAVREISDTDFTRLVETILGYLELKIQKMHPKGSFVVLESVHRPDGKKYVVFFSRRNELVTRADVESLVNYMSKLQAASGLILTTSSFEPEAVPIAESNNVGLADGNKLAALMRRFDLDNDVIRAAELKQERTRVVVAPGTDKELQEAMLAGYEALASKDYMKALDLFDKAIMVKEDYDLPWRLKGNTLDEMGYHEQALECYRRTLELYPESDETWFSLGSCLFSLGRYNEELLCYERALQYNPMMQKSLINKGSTLHRLGRYREALETYDEVLKINYRLEKVHNNRGATLHSLGQLNEALASYNRAIELKHDYVEAWMNKGSLLYEMARYGEALAAFSEMTRIRPELPKGWYLRGLASKKTGDVTKAKASFEAAIRLDPDYVEARRALEDITKRISEKFPEVPRIVQDIFSSEAARPPPAPPVLEGGQLSEDMITRVREERVEELAEEVYGDRAELLFLLGKFDEAFDFLGKSLRLEGEDTPLLTAAGNVLCGLGKYEAAMKTYQHALEIDPDYLPAMFNLQAVMTEQGDSEGSAKASEALRRISSGWQARTCASLDAFDRKDYNQALEDIEVAVTVGDLAALQNYKGLLRLQLGVFDGAGTIFEKTKSMVLDPSEAYNNSGIMYMKKGALEKASAEFDKAIRLNKGNHAAWNNRGCVLYKLERLREAIACFDESFVMLPTTAAYSNKGFTQLALDLLEESLQTFNQALHVAETAETYNNEGIVLERMQRHSDAQVAFKEALRLAPTFKDAEGNLKRVSEASAKLPPKPAPKKQEPVPPREEVIGEKASTEKSLSEITESYLQERRKTELEAMCQALGINARGTRAELIRRILKAKGQAARKK
ncbi:MAG: hypothetical protein A3K76_06460 [Euryarchaeota archaeon RBG_13_57_23]|nr:MAG: hypothetical protein A3K76_06460 [Euryarchaeota archaeon RBG_13_57_23]